MNIIKTLYYSTTSLFHRSNSEEIERQIDKKTNQFTKIFVTSFNKSHILTYEPDNSLLKASLQPSDSTYTKLSTYAVSLILQQIEASSIKKELEEKYPLPTIKMAIEDLAKYALIDLDRKLKGEFPNDYSTFLEKVNRTD